MISRQQKGAYFNLQAEFFSTTCKHEIYKLRTKT